VTSDETLEAMHEVFGRRTVESEERAVHRDASGHLGR